MFKTVMEELCVNGFSAIPKTITALLNEAMKIERSYALNAEPYERTEDRRGYANGFKPKTLNSRLGKLKLNIPQVRGLEFYPSCIEKGERSERALKTALAEMYINGVSTRKVKEVTEALCGFEVSSTQVSNVTKLLDDELEIFRNRPLGEIKYLYLDAQYQKVRIDNQVISQAVLIAIGVNTAGLREIVGVMVKGSEAEINWREFLLHLKERGIHGIQLIISDDHSGLKQARNSVFPNIQWQRCQFHFAQNAQHKANSREQKKAIAEDVRNIFKQLNVLDAQKQTSEIVEKWKKKNPNFSAWLDSNAHECFSVYSHPEELQKKLRTSNGLERLNREIKRRNDVVGIFPNANSLLRLTSAVLIEIHDDWSTATQPYMKFDNYSSYS